MSAGRQVGRWALTIPSERNSSYISQRNLIKLSNNNCHQVNWRISSGLFDRVIRSWVICPWITKYCIFDLVNMIETSFFIGCLWNLHSVFISMRARFLSKMGKIGLLGPELSALELQKNSAFDLVNTIERSYSMQTYKKFHSMSTYMRPWLC